MNPVNNTTMRSPMLEARNAKIRRQYQKLLKANRMNLVKKPAEKAITELCRIFSVHKLSYDTMEKICRDPTYGQSSAAPEPDADPDVDDQDRDTTQKRWKDKFT